MPVEEGEAVLSWAIARPVSAMKIQPCRNARIILGARGGDFLRLCASMIARISRWALPDARVVVCTVLAAGSCGAWLCSGQDTISRTPVPLPSNDNVSAAVRSARDDLFPLMAHFTTGPNKPGAPYPSVFVSGPQRPELPRAEAVIVGRVTDLIPRPLPESDFLYTEYSILIQWIVKNDSEWRGSQSVVAIGAGGIARAADGHTIGFLAHGYGQQIETGEDYLMFLRYREAAECFQFIEVWRIEDGRLRWRARNDSRSYFRGARLEGQRLDAVVARIQTASHQVDGSYQFVIEPSGRK